MANENIYIKEMQELVNSTLPPSAEGNLKTFYPVTHEDAVRDSDGNPISVKLNALESDKLGSIAQEQFDAIFNDW